MWLEEFCDLFDRGLPVDCEISTGELFGDPRANHVHTQNLTGRTVTIFLRYHFHEPIGFSENHRARVCTKLMFGDYNIMAGSTRLFF